MPIKECQINGVSGFKWGDEGKCYTGPDAKKKAMAQAIAASRNGAKAEFAGIKISFDYDDTLTTEKGKDLAMKLIEEGNEVFIISARNDKQGMLQTAKALGIPESRVYATGSNKAKVEKVNELGISKHYDNNQEVVDALKEKGVKI